MPKTFLTVAVIFFGAVSTAIYAQQPEPSRSAPSPAEVLRINTELVQTDVMVFDRQGRFVHGLHQDQFELNLNGASQPVSFFEQVASGSRAEAAQLAAARDPGPKTAERKKIENERAADSGRVIFFFVDDLHLSTASLARARKTLRGFVDNQMNPTDQIAIVSTSGQIGFLQQLTDNPVVLRTAIGRLKYRQNPETATGKTQISGYMASQVIDYGNRELFAYLLESVKVEQQMGPGSRHGDHGLAASYSAVPYLRNRLQGINARGRMTTADTLSVLESLIASAAALPGRKLVFFLSDGFIINERKAGALEALQRLTKAAMRSGVVVYTMDLRGTFSSLGSGMDASTNAYADSSGRRAGLLLGEVTATQEPLKLIADETGGRAIVNTNAFGEGILEAIRETADYYLLAWRPDSLFSPFSDAQKLRIEVKIKDRPDLHVRLRNSLYSKAAIAAPKTTRSGEAQEGSAKTDENPLLTALSALYPDKRLPVLLSLGYIKSDKADITLRAAMQLDRRSLYFDPESRLRNTEVDVVGVAADDRGMFASFKQLLSIPSESSAKAQTVTWSQQLHLKPGLYQVRVAVRERISGRTGSAMQWIELPDAAGARFELSSLFLAERTVESSLDHPTGPHQISVDVDHHFGRGSALRFQLYVYNAARENMGPDVSIQTEVFRLRRQVMSVNGGKVPVTSNGSSLPYWSEIALNSLSPGQYVLQVTATDRIGNRTATQRTNFSVD